MGEVYRARDSKLGRDVALKILPPEMTSEAGRLERFDREARAIAALNHPHIVTIYSTEHVDNVRFLTMELVEGCTLTDLVISTGMAVPRFLDLAIPLADALAAAHHKQITHRDLKPGNVMLSNDGRIKVLDFGLARVGGGDRGEQTLIETLAPITHQGMIVGTMPYMSPEQVEGRPIDARSDLFSLGVIFYELLSGQRPFTGASSPALMSAILRDTPQPLAETRTDVPEALDRLISRLIEKRPEDRLQTARDVFNELKHVRKLLDSSASRLSSTVKAAASATENLAVAVLPFTARGADADAESIASGLTDDITTSLGKFPGLSVISSQATRAHKDSPLDIRQIADRLHARYLISGNLRRSGNTLRTTAQLIDARSGEQLWTENYDRQLGDLFAIQDDLTDHIVATIADRYGVLARSMVQAVQSGTIRESTPAQLLVHTWGFQHRPVADVHIELRAEFESRLAATPDDANLWAELANMYVIEHSLWLNPLPDPLGRALRAARRAIEIDRFNQTGWVWLAITQFYLHDRVAFEEARDRAVRLNPRNAYALAWMGNITTHAGEIERGCALTERSMTINPGHPGWLHFAIFNRHMAAGEYEQALHAAKRANMREFFWMYFAIAAACGHLGRAAEGKAAVAEMIRLAPFLEDEANLREFVTRWYWPEEMIEALVTGVRNARSDDRSHGRSDGRSDERSNVRANERSSDRAKPPSSASGTRAAVTVAVKPFTARSSDQIQQLAEGISDDLATNLARFSYLRVTARPDTARFVVEGSLRSVGSQVRITARLIDASTSEHVWAETFDRDAADPFALQDETAARIAATIGDEDGPIVHAVTDALLSRPIGELDLDELVLRFHVYTEQLDQETNRQLTEALERQLETHPGHASGWAALSTLYAHNITAGLEGAPPDVLAKQMRAADRAVALDSKNQQGWYAVALKATFARDIHALRDACDRVVAINPLSGHTTVACAGYLALAGDCERAMRIYEHCKRLIPHHQDWYYMVPMVDAYKHRRFAEAVQYGHRFTMSTSFAAPLGTAAAAGQLGSTNDAQVAIDKLKRIRPEMLDPETARLYWQAMMWHESDVEDLVAGLRKALALVSSTPAADRPPSSTSGAIRPSTDLSVAVLPFKARGTDDDTNTLADGLTDLITTGLSRFGYLQVLSRSVAERVSSSGDIHPHARYAIEGSVRRDASKARIAVTLVDTQSGKNLWTSTYDRDVSAGTFAIQDDVSSAVVATVGDQTGVLMRAMAATTLDRPLEQLAVAELVVRYHLYAENFDPAEHARLRDAFEHALKREPRAAEGWACLSLLYEHEHSFGFNPLPDSRVRERTAAERAHELDPHSQQAWIAMAGMYCFARDRDGLRNAVERAAGINPLNADLLALGAIFLSVASEHDRATALAQQAMALKPQHAGWYYYPLVNAASEPGDYQEALRYNKKINMPRMPLQHANTAAFAGHLGLASDARAALHALRTIDPRFAEPDGARAIWTGWIWSDEWLASMLDGFTKTKALVDRSDGRSDVRSDTRSDARSDVRSGVRPGEIVPCLVVVQPFKGRGELAEGLTSDVATKLAKFWYVRVMGGDTAARSGGRHRYAIEGEVRESGGTIRTYVRLIDISDGAQLWAQHYDSDVAADTFATIDNLGDRIVATVADSHGELQRALARDPELASNLGVRFFAYIRHLTPADHASLRDDFEAAVAADPGNAELWGRLAVLYTQEVVVSFNPRPDAVARARQASERAIALDARSQAAWFAHAMASFLSRDGSEFAAATERALELNPLSSAVTGTLGAFLAYTGQTARGAALVRRAMALSPHHRPWFFIALFSDAFMEGDAEQAFAQAQRIVSPQLPHGKLWTIAAAGRFGRPETAARSIEEWRQANNNQPFELDAVVRALQMTLWPSPLYDAVLDGIKKAIDMRSDARSDARSDVRSDGREQSIAVLPFTDLSEKKDQDWFCDGIAEEILNALAPLPGLRVAARASAFSFRGGIEDLRAIGDKLQVKTVLEGSVRRSGDRVRITAQLSDALKGQVMWSQRFDREMKDIFDVQDEIARAIVERLRVSLGGESDRLVQKRTSNLEAYELLLRGRTLLTRRGRAVLDAIPLFERAITLDAHLAEAHALLGDSYRLLGLYGFAAASEVMPRAQAGVEQALAIDPDQPEALATLANIAAINDWDLGEHRRRFVRVLEVDPLHVRAHAEHSLVLAALGLPEDNWLEESLSHIRTARSLDPLNAWVMAIEAGVLAVTNSTERAVERAKTAVELDPNNFTARWLLTWAFAEANRPDDALSACEAALAMSGRNPIILATMASIYMDQGEAAKIAAIWAELSQRSETSFVACGVRANVAAAAGRWDEARELLTMAIAQRDPWATFWKTWPWRPVWKDEQCAAMLKATPLFQRTSD